MHKAVAMVLMINDVQSLTADITLSAGIVLISTNFNYTIVLDSNLKPTEICSQYTCCFFQSIIAPPFVVSNLKLSFAFSDVQDKPELKKDDFKFVYEQYN